jgi:hypothetical protein
MVHNKPCICHEHRPECYCAPAAPFNRRELRILIGSGIVALCLLLGVALAKAEPMRASYYGSESGTRTASGARFVPSAMTAAAPDAAVRDEIARVPAGMRGCDHYGPRPVHQGSAPGFVQRGGSGDRADVGGRGCDQRGEDVAMALRAHELFDFVSRFRSEQAILAAKDIARSQVVSFDITDQNYPTFSKVFEIVKKRWGSGPLHLPFDPVLVQATRDDVEHTWALCSTVDEQFRMRMFRFTEGEFLAAIYDVIVCSSGSVRGVMVNLEVGTTAPIQEQASADLIVTLSMIVLSGFEMMNYKGVVVQDYTPSETVNNRRSKERKTPFFACRTLTIDPEKVRLPRVNRGGTHASPAAHWRRGHTRQYKSGKVVHIEPMFERVQFCTLPPEGLAQMPAFNIDRIICLEQHAATRNNGKVPCYAK